MEEKIKTIRLEDKEYPLLLKKIPSPPETLYIKGNLSNNEKRFAIVGTRHCSDYGKKIALSIARDLSKAGLIIVSGMAIGIDTFAHKGVFKEKRRTIAVLGTGIDEKSIYPRENIRIAKKILENKGCLVSEYPPGTKGTPSNFPQRNRIIAGLSLGVLVVEANFGSGALITAKWAEKYRRKIFAVPGLINSPNSKGCHFLIKQEAKLVENADDILKELSLPFREIYSKRY